MRRSGALGTVAMAALASFAWSQGSSRADPPPVRSPAESARRGLKFTSARSTMLEVDDSEQTLRGLEFGRVSNLLMLLTPDGQIQPVKLGRQVKVRTLDERFEPSNPREVELSLRAEFGTKFKTLRTAHYLICHNTSDAFARETAELVEQLYRAFTAYFGARGMGFTKPEFPMVVIIFDDESEFRNYLASSPGISDMTKITGIYSVYTNRIALFNMSGKEAKKYGDVRWHNQSTVIHEATHQIAFNSGCHHRFADTPAWFVEGLAMYFETPEVRSQEIVWNSVGRLNRPRLDRFLKSRKQDHKPDSIARLVQDDEAFRSDTTAADAYAESWALTYFLVNRRMPQFLKYVKLVAAKPSLEQDTSEQRLADFQNCFGTNLRLLEASFMRFVDEL